MILAGFGILIMVSSYLLLIGLKLEGNLPYWSWAEVFLLPIIAPVAMCGGVFLILLFSM